MVLGLIGETVDIGDEICGARVVDKSKGNHVVYRFELWLRTNDHSTADRSVSNHHDPSPPAIGSRVAAKKWLWLCS